MAKRQLELIPEILTQSSDWAAVNKPPGLVVHDVPGNKHSGNTLVDWIKLNIPEINQNFPATDPRPGIVHRLDADTSGIILISKNPKSLKLLQAQFKDRTTKKIYLALVAGNPPSRGEITGDIIRKAGATEHQVKRLSFSWDKKNSKPATTTYKTIKRYILENQPLALLEVSPKTGRTHQIRVHLSSEGWPIIGDQLYNNKVSRELSQKLNLHRQFLHAYYLEFNDPKSHLGQQIQCELAPDLEKIISKLDSSATIEN